MDYGPESADEHIKRCPKVSFQKASQFTIKA